MSDSGNDGALQHNYYTIIRHPMEPRVLVVETEGHDWSLPHLQRNDYLDSVNDLNSFVRQDIGIDVITLRRAYRVEDKEVAKRIDSIYVMENHSPDRQPEEGMRWIGRADLAGLSIAWAEQVPVIEAYLAEVESGLEPALRSPWQKEGWFAQATAWIDAELARLRYARSGAIEQVRQWGISSILRVPTGAGDLYFKAVPAFFAQEPPVTRELALRFPEYVPHPLAVLVRPEQGWMLMQAFSGKLLQDVLVEGEEWDTTLRLLARMQIACAGSVEDLLAAGCADRRLDKVPGQYEHLLSEPEMLVDLTAEEIESLRALVPRLPAMCERLAAYRVPQTLVHGDFHARNVVLDGSHTVIFDWTDACISHPFLDLPTILEYDVPREAHPRLRDVYLQAWTAYEPEDRLLEAFELGWALGALHQAISYRNIMAGLEPDGWADLGWGISFWLRVFQKASVVLP